MGSGIGDGGSAGNLIVSGGTLHLTGLTSYTGTTTVAASGSARKS